MNDRHAPRARRAALVLAGLLALGPVQAQPTPTTGDILVNTTTFEHQTSPAVAGLSGGGFVVVWESNPQDGDGGGVYAQRFDGAGAHLGEEFRINAASAGHQNMPAVAALTDGGFVVAWASAVQEGADADVYVRRFDASGGPLGGDVGVNTTTADDQSAPVVAALAGGGFVVAWASDVQDGSGYGIYARRYDGAGAPASEEFRVNTATANAQTEPSVAALSGGGFVVAWTSSDGSLTDVWAQRYDGAGAPAGGAFRVNTYTQNHQAQPAVAALPGGGFVVAWASLIQDLSGWGTYVQRFTAAGAPEGPEFRANAAVTFNNQWLPAVAGLPGDAFVAVWASNLQDDSGYGVYGRRYTAAGVPDGEEFRVNVYTQDPQTDPSVAALAGGGFAVAWESDGQDGGLYGIVARVYDGAPSAAEPGPDRGVALRGPAPSPAHGLARLTLEVAAAQVVRVVLYDALGRPVAVLHEGLVAAGPTEIGVDTGALRPGVYLLRVEGDSFASTRRVAVVR
jgi:hypothetical protein